MVQEKANRERTDVRVMLSLPPKMAEQLKERAKEEATPVSVLVRRWIARELREGRYR
jgi:hypothetical protein